MVTISSGGREDEIKVRSGLKMLKMEEWDKVMKDNDTAIREDQIKVKSQRSQRS